MCLRTEIARAPCRRCNGEAVPRAEKFGDLKTADHKVLIEDGESRNNHQYVENFSGDGKEFTKVSRAVTEAQNHLYTDNSLEFGKACEEVPLNHCTSTLHRSETNGIAESAVRGVMEGTSAVRLQSGLDEKW